MIDIITVRRRPGEPSRGHLAAGNRVLPCALGRSGPSVFKREGDGATPAAWQMRAIWGYWRADRGPRPVSGLALTPIGPDDGWCDAPGHPVYNMPVALPFGPSHERMWRADSLYDICIVLDWNMPPVRSRNRGSAIFLHLARPGYQPTEGCVALGRPDMVWLLARMDERTRICVEP